MFQNEFQAVQIMGIDGKTLLDKIDSITSQLNELTANRPPVKENYLTRLETIELLNISLVTLHNWSKKGILQPRKIGKKVLFVEHEVRNALHKKANK